MASLADMTITVIYPKRERRRFSRRLAGYVTKIKDATSNADKVELAFNAGRSFETRMGRMIRHMQVGS